MTEPTPPADPGSTVAVVVMAYGTPARPEDVEAYYTHIRRGRPPEPEQLADLQRRYDALGGCCRWRAAHRGAVRGSKLPLRPAPGRYRVGIVHAAPFIEDAVTTLADGGAARVVGLVLAPHYSGFSVGEYQRRLAEAAGARRLHRHGVDQQNLRSPPTSTSSPARCGTRWHRSPTAPGWCSPPTPCPSACSSTTRTRTSSARAPPRWSSGWAAGPPTGTWPGRAPAAPPSPGAAPTSWR
ncbi:MAG: ferrochelatase [Microthrixaceae bacterium]|nr:ferrochelatase [Microthrixaceae bacterium]